MIAYLLLSAFLLGVEESQTANVTGEAAGTSQPIPSFTSANAAEEPGNVTSSPSKDERSRLELELENNQTSGNMSYQNQDGSLNFTHCDREMLQLYSPLICGKSFETDMLSLGAEQWCVLKQVLRPYMEMTSCLEKLSNLVHCYYPNPDIQDFFLEIHALYFHNCSQDELLLQEAPEGLAIGLTLIPVSLIPALVYLVVRKSNVQD